ncbi:hypothetical protein ER308_08635 [Egibacter rhizosphaerae]|uniref:NADPH-dependent reductive aminase-like C-terminal domain-containing protein n=1 Tax=Egibacter rhizosphaerae TaxID=1670831 RepID=A0A411YEG9_9ACTN|nr:hypothetical protein [Egibacter rhizosphaerae]QBI19609.1 hypothetical protein ER308_08635 [Egibacter rhizosphaerae]
MDTEGIDVASFTPLVTEVLTEMVGFLPELAREIDEAVYPPDLGPLRTQAALMGDLIENREARGVDAQGLRHVQPLMNRRVASGHGEDGFSSLIEEIRRDHDYQRPAGGVNVQAPRCANPPQPAGRRGRCDRPCSSREGARCA